MRTDGEGRSGRLGRFATAPTAPLRGETVPLGAAVAWSSYAFLAATGVYAAALFINALRGMPMPPIPTTRLIASLTVFVGAPALVWLVWAIARGSELEDRAAARAAQIAVSLFALGAILNRVFQLAILAGATGPIWGRLDLYVASSPASFIELLAWDGLLGVTAICLSRLLVTRNEKMPSRLFAAAGVLMLAGEVLYLLALLGVAPALIAPAAMGSSIVGWVIGMPAAVLVTAITAQRKKHLALTPQEPIAPPSRGND